MGKFESQRKEVIRKKNEFALGSMELNDQIEAFDKKRSEVEEGISRIPTDLPEELQQQVDAAIENVRDNMNSESDELSNRADDLKKKADEAVDLARGISSELQQKSQKMSSLADVPLIGSFAETKGSELADQAEQMVDLASETVEYQDKLAIQQNKLRNKR